MTPNDLPPEWREWYEERAGVMEYEANMSREDAEKLAMRETLEAMRKAKA